MRTDRLLPGMGKALAVAAIVLWSIFPIAFIVLSSFKPGRDIFAVPPKFFFEPTFAHYLNLWERWGSFFDGLLNSLVVTAGAAILAVAASSLAGFIYSRHSSRMLSARPAISHEDGSQPVDATCDRNRRWCADG